MPTVKLKARYGTWYRSDAPDFRFYNYRTYLALRNSGPVMHSYVYFTTPFPNVPGVKVTRARLRLWLIGGTTNTGTRTISVQRVASGHNYTTMTYKTRPTKFTGPTSSVQTTGPLSSNHMFEIDVTADIAAAVKGAFFSYIVTTTAPFTMQLHGANASKLQPELEVTYTQPPTKPRDLSPAMGRAVSTAKPHITFSYYDTGGSDKISAVRVQTNPTNNFNAPAWDSGIVATSEAGLDLANEFHPPIAANATTWYRVQVQSASGVWSSWSDPTSFVYRPNPTVTITAPGETFSDPTPPIVWTYSGATAMTQWRARMQALIRARWVTLDDSGWQSGVADTWTPKKAATDTSLRHRVVVDARDSYSREAVPGALPYAQTIKSTAFAPTTTVEPPSNLVAMNTYPRPDVVVSFTRSELPDFWAIYRDGRLIDRVPGPDLHTSGTAYVYRDFPPRGNHTWTVRAVRNNQTSKAATARVTVDFKGTWLFDPDGSAVCIQDDREHAMSMPEESAVHEPLGSDRAVVITQALRGYEGTIEGLITDLKGQAETAETWRANLLRFKAEPTTVRTLVIEDQSFPVVTRNVQLKHAPKRHGWTASYEFFQQGGLLFDPLEV